MTFFSIAHNTLEWQQRRARIALAARTVQNVSRSREPGPDRSLAVRSVCPTAHPDLALRCFQAFTVEPLAKHRGGSMAPVNVKLSTCPPAVSTGLEIVICGNELVSRKGRKPRAVRWTDLKISNSVKSQ